MPPHADSQSATPAHPGTATTRTRVGLDETSATSGNLAVLGSNASAALRNGGLENSRIYYRFPGTIDAEMSRCKALVIRWVTDQEQGDGKDEVQ